MRFTALVVAGLAAVASAIPAQEAANNIKQITTLSRNLQTPAKGLDILDGPLLTLGQGDFPVIITGFTEIVNTGTAYLKVMNAEKYNEADSEIIFDAFRTFVQVHQELLNILIGKAGLFNTVPFVGQPVAALLRGVEGVVDSLTLSLIDMAESQSMNIKDSGDSLGSTLDTAISSYEGLNL